MPLDGQDEGLAAAFQAFEQISTAKTREPLASAREVGDDPGFCRRWWRVGLLLDIVAQAIARQSERINGGDNRIGIEEGILIVWVMIVEGELDCLRLARGQKGTCP